MERTPRECRSPSAVARPAPAVAKDAGLRDRQRWCVPFVATCRKTFWVTLPGDLEVVGTLAFVRGTLRAVSETVDFGFAAAYFDRPCDTSLTEMVQEQC